MLRFTNDKKDELKLKRILKFQAAAEARSDSSGDFANRKSNRTAAIASLDFHPAGCEIE
jgi:hypothetical protein